MCGLCNEWHAGCAHPHGGWSVIRLYRLCRNKQVLQQAAHAHIGTRKNCSCFPALCAMRSTVQLRASAAPHKRAPAPTGANQLQTSQIPTSQLDESIARAAAAAARLTESGPASTSASVSSSTALSRAHGAGRRQAVAALTAGALASVWPAGAAHAFNCPGEHGSAPGLPHYVRVRARASHACSPCACRGCGGRPPCSAWRIDCLPLPPPPAPLCALPCTAVHTHMFACACM